MMTPDDRGRLAYETYYAALEPHDMLVMDWERMNSTARKAWVKAAAAVVKSVEVKV